MFSFWKKKKRSTQIELDFKIFADFECKIPKFLSFESLNLYSSVSDILKNEKDLQENQEFFLLIKLRKAEKINSIRKLNFYESPLSLFTIKPQKYDYFFIFSSEENSITNNLNDKNIQLEELNNIEKKNLKKKKKGNVLAKNQIKQGFLNKYWENGKYKQKFFVLYNNELVYYDVNEPDKIKRIPLCYAKIERTKKIQDKTNVFGIKTLQKYYYLQSAKLNEMNSWIIELNTQITMVTENTDINEFNERIKEMEIKNFNNYQQFIDKTLYKFENYIESIERRDILEIYIEKKQKKLKEIINIYNLVKLYLTEENIDLRDCFDMIILGLRHLKKEKNLDFLKIITDELWETLEDKYDIIRQNDDLEIKKEIIIIFEKIANSTGKLIEKKIYNKFLLSKELITYISQKYCKKSKFFSDFENPFANILNIKNPTEVKSAQLKITDKEIRKRLVTSVNITKINENNIASTYSPNFIKE